jgi:hypothetical protein
MDEEFAFHRETGVRMMTIEGGNQWAANGLTYYACAKMTWDGDRDPLAIVDDFCTNYFGPAAGSMRRYFDLRAEAFRRGEKCERNPRKIPYQEYLDRFDQLLSQAMAEASSKEHQRHVGFYQRYQRYMRQYYAVIEALDAYKARPSVTTRRSAENAVESLAHMVDQLGEEGAIAKPSARHHTLGWMNKSLSELRRAQERLQTK